MDAHKTQSFLHQQQMPTLECKLTPFRGQMSLIIKILGNYHGFNVNLLSTWYAINTNLRSDCLSVIPMETG